MGQEYILIEKAWKRYKLDHFQFFSLTDLPWRDPQRSPKDLTLSSHLYKITFKDESFIITPKSTLHSTIRGRRVRIKGTLDRNKMASKNCGLLGILNQIGLICNRINSIAFLKKL